MPEPTPKRRRELLREMTQQAIEAGTYGEPAPEMRPTPERTPRHAPTVPTPCGVTRDVLFVGDGVHVCEHIPDHAKAADDREHICCCGFVWNDSEAATECTPPDDTPEGLRERIFDQIQLGMYGPGGVPHAEIPLVDDAAAGVWAEVSPVLERLRAELDAELKTKAIGRSYIEMRDFAQRETARAEQAEAERDALKAAVAEVRRLQEMTIAASCRMQAIEQAEDTLAVLDRTLGATVDAPETTQTDSTDQQMAQQIDDTLWRLHQLRMWAYRETTGDVLHNVLSVITNVWDILDPDRTRGPSIDAPETPDDVTAKPKHIGGRANAEGCPGCAGLDLPYPWICPGDVEEATDDE